jgi:molecular chaperone Hsp33
MDGRNMSDPEISQRNPGGIPTREPAYDAADDVVMPFEVAALDLRGRVVRLGPVVDDILERHAYPLPVAKLLGEAIVLTVLLGSALKIQGRLILQTQADGPVRMLVVDYTAPDKVRACARFDKDRLDAAVASGKADSGALLGRGHLAMTIDQGADTNRYQGLVALDGGSLEDAAHEYFLRSEQIPTRVRLAVAEELRAGEGGPSHRWRAGGMLLQFLPRAPERMRVADLHPGDAPEGTAPHEVQEDDAWAEGRALIETVEDIELIDPALSSERLVYRLFHERGVRVFDVTDIRAECSCSRPTVESMLQSFSQDDRDHMVENGVISVTCEFCSSSYMFAPEEVAAGHECAGAGAILSAAAGKRTQAGAGDVQWDVDSLGLPAPL